MDTAKRPEVMVFAGPNGSGKSTITQLLNPIGIDYINADDIKWTTGCTDLEAAQAATKLREEHVAAGKPFCFETVMSTDRNPKLIQNARESGFFIRTYIRTYIVLTCDSAINISRVHGRVQSGGHDVPVEKIISHYDRSLRLVKDVVAVSHVCNIYDNSSQYPVRFFNKKVHTCFYKETPFWDLAAIQELTGIPSMQTRPLNLHNPFTELDFTSQPTT